jgi:high-affinity iron transporter
MPIIAVLVVVSAAVMNVPGGVSAQSKSMSPATAAQDACSALFSAQQALLAGDSAGASQAVEDARAAAEPIIASFTADPTAGVDIQAALDAAATAVGEGDGVALAIARAAMWTAVLRGSYAETMKAVSAGQADQAGSWLLLRDFRPTTRFSRPGIDSTLAIRTLAAGELSPADAAATVNADLLDTFQGQVDASLSAIDSAIDDEFRLSQAEAAGMAQGYWTILADSYEKQRGPGARHQADAAFAELTAAVQAGDSARTSAARAGVDAVMQGFRAAPLSEEEQARRGGQLLRFLSLIPVEYGRGVKQGQVVIDLEIQEAQAFLDGARASFSDLRPILDQQDPAVAASVEARLDQLDQDLRSAAKHENVAELGTIRETVQAASNDLESILPEAWTRAGGEADFDVIASILDQMEAAVAAGQYSQAGASRIEAYAIFESGPEKRLLAFAPSLAQKVEELFWQGSGDVNGLAYALDDQASSLEVGTIRLELDKALTKGKEQLGAGRPATGAVVFNAATIVFREGLEAVLILASLLASMVGANQRYKKPLAAGAIAAFIATAGLFVLARSVLLSLGRYGEKLEAIVSLVAIGVLLIVLNWFFHKVYWTKWIAKHHERRRVLIGGAAGQMLGLVILGFTSVFREGGETVLFLQALVLDAGTKTVIEGTLLGLAGVAVVGTAVFVMQRKLPHKKMLTVTGVMIAAVLVTMVGNTVHVFQIIGWAPITRVGTLEFPSWMGIWFGLYATWEGLIAQTAAVVFVIGSYFAAEWTKERGRRAMAEKYPEGITAFPQAKARS